jgi:Holliday junction resolvase RusA-like endonuclease
MYTPETADAMKAGLAVEAIQQMDASGWWRDYHGPVSVTIAAIMARPKDHFLRGKLRDGAPKRHAQKPDIDNIEKAVLDALTKARVWRDDCQVDWVLVRRRWAIGDEKPGLIVEVTQ